MTSLMNLIHDHELLLAWLGSISLGLLVLTLVALPIVVIQLPWDYFVRDRRTPAHLSRRHPVLWWVLTIVKNLAGLALILSGLAMLVLPGQGLLTILMGLALTNFPGKYALERRLVRRPAVASTMNRLRAAAGRRPLEIPEVEGAHSEEAG